MKNYSSAFKQVLALFLALLFSSCTALANDTPSHTSSNCEQELTLAAFRAFALHKSPLVAEIDRVYAEELATAFETEVLSNPELQVEQTYTRMKLGGDSDPQSQVSLGQAIRLSNFGSRERVASLIRKSADLQLRARLLELTQILIVQFRTLFVLQQSEKIILNAEQRAAKKVAQIRDAVNKGLLSQGDEQLFEGEKYRLQAQRKGVSARIATLQSELAKSTGSTCLVLAKGEEAHQEIASEIILLEKAHKNELSEASRLNLLTSLAQEETRLAELDAFPQITPRLVYQHTNDGGDFIGAGITIPLPFWNRNQAQKMRSTAGQKVAETRSNFHSNQGLEAQIRNLRRATLSTQEQSDLFTKKVIPSFEAALRSQERLYAEGKENVLQVWQTLRTFNEAQTQGLLLWLEAVSARVQLSILIGEEV
jgi:outer membrane protein TolC